MSPPSSSLLLDATDAEEAFTHKTPLSWSQGCQVEATGAGAEASLLITLIQNLLLHQKCTATFSKEAQWEQLVTIFTNTALQLALVFSATEISDIATLPYAQMYDEQIFVTEISVQWKKKKGSHFRIYFNVWKIKAASQNFSHGTQVYHSTSEKRQYSKNHELICLEN